MKSTLQSKYSKEFILLCSNWIRGEEQDKTKFEKYLTIMKKNSNKNNGYRIWDFEPTDLKEVLFNQGKIEIDQNAIESCFFIHKEEKIQITDIEKTNKKLSMWTSNIKIITLWKDNMFFDIYSVLKEAISDYNTTNLNKYTEEEINLIKARYINYKHQNEILHLDNKNHIKSNEIEYILLNKNFIEEYIDAELGALIYGEMEDYFVLKYNEKFFNLRKGHEMFGLFKTAKDFLNGVNFKDEKKPIQKKKFMKISL